MLETIFNPENAFFTFINKVIDLFLLSLMWTICSIPIVTMGAASAALYYGTVKAVRKQRSYALREYWRGFRQNLKKGIIIHTFLLAAGGMMFYTDIPMVFDLLEKGKGVDLLLLVLFVIKAVIWLGMACWLYPLMSRFEEGGLKLAEAALFLLVRYLPVTVILLVFFMITAGMVIWEPLTAFMVPGLFTLAGSFFLEPVLRRVCGDEGEAEDKWYLEGRK